MNKKNLFPSFLRQKLPLKGDFVKTKALLQKHEISTVCEEAKCPNRFLCFQKKCATFLALGKFCTRHCSFCDVAFSKAPLAPDPHEPQKIANFIKELNLSSAVITMVSRDDLEDGGASHIAKIVQEIRKKNKKIKIEVLTSDFQGKKESLDIILSQDIDLFNHNVETIKKLTPLIRDKASYSQSLEVLKYVKSKKKVLVKSGFMVGLGESEEEVKNCIKDLSKVCDIITIGQYLQPSNRCTKVKEFVPLEKYKIYEEFGYSLGLKKMHCSPFVRSSFNSFD
jgi:lipoyl synthase